MVTARVSAIEACRQLAHEIWRVERPSEPFVVHGLISERTVRERLQKTAMELEAQKDVPDALALKLMGINFSSDDPLSILERTEEMVSLFKPGTYLSADHLIEGSGTSIVLTLRLLIVQSLAGRLGRWA